MSKLVSSLQTRLCTSANKFSELFTPKLLPSTTPLVSVSISLALSQSPLELSLTFVQLAAWHTLSQRILASVQRHELAEQALKELASMPKSEDPNDDRKAQISEMLVPNVESARAEAESYLQQAVRMVRQSIVISERTNGIDSHETIQQYTDLGLLEHAAGNVNLGLRLLKHAVDLWSVSYGPAHPAVVTILVSLTPSLLASER